MFTCDTLELKKKQMIKTHRKFEDFNLHNIRYIDLTRDLTIKKKNTLKTQRQYLFQLRYKTKYY